MASSTRVAPGIGFNAFAGGFALNVFTGVTVGFGFSFILSWSNGLMALTRLSQLVIAQPQAFALPVFSRTKAIMR